MSLALVVGMVSFFDTNTWAKKKMCLNKKKLTLYVGQYKTLKVKNKKKSKKVKWKSTKKKVAKVSKKGKVWALKKGKATIIAKVGKKKFKCKVVVKKAYVPEEMTKQETIPEATTNVVEPTTSDKGQVTTGPSGGETTAQPTTQAPTTKPQPTEIPFDVDPTIQKPFGVVVSNPEDGIIRVVWGAGNPNCYNLYIDGKRVRTKVAAASYDIPVQTEGNHEVAIATVNPEVNKESERAVTTINVHGTAPEETTAIAPEDMPAIDESIPKKNGKMILQLNNKTDGKYEDKDIYWIVIGRNPSSHKFAYLDLDGNLIEADSSNNDGTIGSRKYAQKVVHTLAERKYVHLPAIESGRMYISYGEPVYITFNGTGKDVGYAGPDVNNPHDANYHTLFEYLEFTTGASGGGLVFHGNTTRVDFFSIPMVARLVDEYGGYDRCVGDVGTRQEIYNAFANEVSDKFDTLITDERIMCPAKLTFSENGPYKDYYDDYINRFWNKYANEDLVIANGQYRGRTSGNRLIMSNSSGTYYIDKPSTQDVLEGRGAFNRISTENKNNPGAGGSELSIETMLCAAFTRGLAMEPDKWNKPSEYYMSGEIFNEYAKFFHGHSVGGKAYGFCYDDVCDQSTLVECANAAYFAIDLKW